MGGEKEQGHEQRGRIELVGEEREGRDGVELVGEGREREARSMNREGR